KLAALRGGWCRFFTKTSMANIWRGWSSGINSSAIHTVRHHILYRIPERSIHMDGAMLRIQRAKLPYVFPLLPFCANVPEINKEDSSRPVQEHHQAIIGTTVKVVPPDGQYGVFALHRTVCRPVKFPL